jgi:HlyD family secretion protein
VRFVVRQELNALLVPNAGLRWSPSSLAMVVPEARAGSPGATAQDDPPGENKGASSKAPKDSGTVWVTDGEFVRPIEVKVGISDGVNAVVLADNLQEGQEVVTGETRGSAQSDTKSPFLPPTIKR